MEKKLSPINSLDIGKFIMAIFVIAIHTSGLQSADNWYLQSCFRNITDMAVPFFFISSAFLLTQKISTLEAKDEKLHLIRRYFFRILRLYIIWNIIYLPFAIYGYYIENSSIVHSLLSYFWNLIFKGEHYYSWPLWYLLGTLYATIIVYYLTKRKRSILFFELLCITLFLIGQTACLFNDRELLNESVPAVKVIIMLIGNGRLISGMSYFILGYIIAYRKDPINTVVILLGLSFVLTLSILIYQAFAWYYIKIFIAYLLFNIVLSININHDFIFFRKSSTIMYFTHMIPFFIYSNIVNQEFAYGLMGFLVSCIFTILLSLFIYKINNKKLNYIFG